MSTASMLARCGLTRHQVARMLREDAIRREAKRLALPDVKNDNTLTDALRAGRTIGKPVGIHRFKN